MFIMLKWTLFFLTWFTRGLLTIHSKHHNIQYQKKVQSTQQGLKFSQSLPSNARGIFTEPLPRYERGNTQTHTHTDSNVIS
jgi:hypothetical protein